MSTRRILSVTVCLAVLISGSLSAQTKPNSPGQALTLLPSGKTLITGGLDNYGQPSNQISLIDLDGSTHILSTRMADARAGHTATVLPDGTVLIVGGIGADTHLVSALEIFDPATESIQTILATLVPRAFHSATVLTDGKLLIMGGVTEGGIYTDEIQLWSYQNRSAITIAARMLYPRIQHSATLLADGDVLISGGRSANPSDRPENEVFDHVQLTDHAGGTPDSIAKPIQIAQAVPADNSTDVSIAQLIAIRLTIQAIVTTMTDSTVSLSDAAGNAVAIRVVAAEGGRLGFVLPASPLQPGASYLLTLSNITDFAGNVLPVSVIHFRTAGTLDDSAGELWIPGPEALKGNWNSQTGGSEWQKQPALQATAGVTALSGQVLRLNGFPLAGVQLSIGSNSTKSDSTGRFLLKNLKPGHQVLTIDGRVANRATVEYGLFEVGVDIVAAKTNVLKYTIWMTRLDSEHAIIIPSPTSAPDTVLTTPLLPGLEFHLPANTVIVDHEGHPTRRLTITPIPLVKPPFPLPLGVAVPIYFTIQPGGSYIDVQGATNATLKGGRLIYPNSFGNQPGTVFDFWNYDAESRGWYIYGQGKVTSDGKQIVPNPSVIVYQLTGAMVGGTGPAPGTFSPPGNPPKGGEPVDLSSGLFEYDKTDLAVSDIMPLVLRRTYRTNDMQQRPFGIGTTHNFDFFMVGDTLPYTYQELITPNGSRMRFNRISSGTLWEDAVYEDTDANTPYYGALLQWNTSSLPGSWLMTLKDGTRLSFPDSFNSTTQDCQAVIQITDRHNNAIRFQRGSSCQLLQVTSPSGRYISFQYDALGRINQATDNSGRYVTYQYDSLGNLWTVTDANGGTTTFTYDSNHNMLTITDARGITYLTNEYDANGRVYQQTLADGGTYQFSWTPSNNSFPGWTFICPECVTSGTVSSFSRYSPNDSQGYLGLIASVAVTDPRGYVREVQFDNYGNKISDTQAVGVEPETFNYAYYGDGLSESVADPLSRITSTDYDGLGNLTVLTRLAGLPGAVTTTFTYTPNFSQLATVTDPLGQTTTIGHDQNGDPNSITDPLGNQATASYFGTGQIKSASDALGNTTTFGYAGPDLATITDPVGNQTRYFNDLLGRTTAITDPAGNETQYQYNNVNQLVSITDPLGNTTRFKYDANGNLTKVTDANNHANTYTYNSMDRVTMRTDPLSRSESYSYDPNGNPVSYTDRKGQLTNYSYDPLNQLTTIAYGVVNGVAQDTISYSYDSVNRLHQAADSISGTITRNYDSLDRLSSEVTPFGSVSYSYDNANRRRTMQVSGQSLINYGWDAANRLNGITQGLLSVGVSYDTDNRHSSTLAAIRHPLNECNGDITPTTRYCSC
jgi:YD repeat-containing protein